MKSFAALDSLANDLRGTKAARARVLAAIGLAMVWRGRSLDEVIDRLRDDTASDAAFMQELLYGACRWHHRFVAIESKLLERPLAAKQDVIRALIHIGFYQLESSNIPAHAAVDSTVKSVYDLEMPRFSKLVNGVLRNYLRQRESIEATFDDRARYAYPAWMLARIQNRFDNPAQVLEAGNQYPPMTLRAHAIDRDTLIERLRKQGIDCSAGVLCEDAVRLEQALVADTVDGFGRDWIIQDEAAQLAAIALAPEAGDAIVDVCAAPGGKSMHLAARRGEGPPIVLVDASSTRLKATKKRLDMSAVEAEYRVGDASDPATLSGLSASRVLVDAPCSSLGVIRRHPDIKIHRRETDIKKLARTQASIVANAWQIVTPGGMMLYVTCTLTHEENEAIMTGFLAKHEDAQVVALDHRFGDKRSVGYQRAPGDDGADGFYYCLITKRKDGCNEE